MIEIPLTKGKIAVVSDEDYLLIAQYTWRYNPHRSGYAFAHIDGKTTYMHRLIINAPKGLEVDHINGDSLDNQRDNLRIATRRENAQNSRRHRTMNPTSVYKGVYRVTARLWAAQIRTGGKDVKLGSFSNEVDAARAYDDAARKHFGAFARTNFQV